MKEKIFTLEEASALLPDLRQRISEIQRLRESMQNPDFKVLFQNAWSNGGGKIGIAFFQLLHHLLEQIVAIQQKGVILRDIKTGLVDFPARLGNRKIFYCWKIDEDEIRYWHDEESGFAGRQSL